MGYRQPVSIKSKKKTLFSKKNDKSLFSLETFFEKNRGRGVYIWVKNHYINKVTKETEIEKWLSTISQLITV